MSVMPVVFQKIFDRLKDTCPIRVDLDNFDDLGLYNSSGTWGVFISEQYAPIYKTGGEAIYLNPKKIENDSDWFYTLFHELCHATGTATRLNRPAIVDGDVYHSCIIKRYSEELIAEFGAILLAEMHGLNKSMYYKCTYISILYDVLSDNLHIKQIKSLENQAEEAANYAYNNWTGEKVYDSIVRERYLELYERLG